MTGLRHFYETGRQIYDEPMICLFEDFLEEREINALLDAARNQLQDALVSADKRGVKSRGRSGSNCWVTHDSNQLINSLARRVSEVVGIELRFAESLQVVHYREQEEYSPHYDAWDAATERGQRCMANGGQRLVSCLLYLNNPASGGNTFFPRLDLEVRALRGRMLLFHNCHDGNNVRHPASLHGGMPVLEGEKWACNFWFRERALGKTGALTAQARGRAASPRSRRIV